MRREAARFDVGEVMTGVLLVALVLAAWRLLGPVVGLGLGVWLGLAFVRVRAALRAERAAGAAIPASRRAGVWLDSLYAAALLSGLPALCGALAVVVAEFAFVAFVELALGGLAVPSNRRLMPVYFVMAGASGLLAATWAARRLAPALWPNAGASRRPSRDTIEAAGEESPL
jgi:hypothetical protein